MPDDVQQTAEERLISRMRAALWSVIREWQSDQTLSQETERAVLLALASEEERAAFAEEAWAILDAHVQARRDVGQFGMAEQMENALAVIRACLVACSNVEA